MKTITLLISSILISGIVFSQPTTWASRGPGGGGAIVGAGISPFNGNEFYLTCDMSDMFHTTDFGQSYTIIPFTQLQVQNKSQVQFTSIASKLFTLNRPFKKLRWRNNLDKCKQSLYRFGIRNFCQSA